MQIDYEIDEVELWKHIRSSEDDWAHNLETIRTWSPYGSEEDLFDQVCVVTSLEKTMRILNSCSKVKNRHV